MQIIKGDTVIVLAGRDKGKSGKVAKALHDTDRVIVAGINMVKKAERAKRTGQKGQMIEKPMPIHVSNVSLIDPDTNKPTRLGNAEIGGKWVRIAKRSGKEI